MEAALDFPEEAEELAPATLDAGLAAQITRPSGLAATYEAGRLLREGLLTVIAGRPNAGKSSLLNRLLDLDRAIVAEIPGTTRDLIEETITLGGILVRLSDTAGLRPAQDRLEELSIRRTRERLAQADLVLYLLDGSEPCSPEDRAALQELRGRRGLAVINKADLPPALEATELTEVTSFPVVRISARTGEGIEALKQAMVNLALGGGLRLSGEMVTQARHHQLLESCLSSRPGPAPCSLPATPPPGNWWPWNSRRPSGNWARSPARKWATRSWSASSGSSAWGNKGSKQDNLTQRRQGAKKRRQELRWLVYTPADVSLVSENPPCPLFQRGVQSPL